MTPPTSFARLPESLTPLDELARNLWWSWDPGATELMAEISPRRWERTRHNPVAILQDLSPERVEQLSRDQGFVSRLNQAHGRLQSYLNDRDTWAHRSAPQLATGADCLVYLSMEFGLHESMRIYSGGLGVLAGDHTRSASDLGLNFVGVGLMYRQGYFRQLIDDNSQVSAYPRASFERLPITLLLDDDGEPIRVPVPHGHHEYTAQAWELKVGRARLILLDTDHDGNSFEHRYYTRQLYGGDARTRVAQEVLLGIGGVRMIQALGLKPRTLHLNEGHCAFAALELLRQRVAAGVPLGQATTQVRQRTVFTTHTPVPAGHDRFGWDLINEALGGYRDAMGWPHGTLMDLGRVHPGDIHEPLCMTVLALKLSRKANGVSALHGQVSRQMWRGLYSLAMNEDQVPIGHITNGVHPLFWLGPELRSLFDEQLPGWMDHLQDEEWWLRVNALPDAMVWQAHLAQKRRLLTAVTGKFKHPGLDLDVPTLGFARRFAPYKRANLLFTDPDRLRRMLAGPRPFQLIMAGKAHPQDLHGQALLSEVLRWLGAHPFRDRMVFFEDYDITQGRLLTQGCDVWLNNPRRPREASGTSGQKAAMNGCPNASVLDGWWPEAFDGDNGWAIGQEREYETVEQQDADDAEALYALLEERLLPEWYDRDKQGIPRRWVQRMKHSIATCMPQFNTHRMVADYTRQVYLDDEPSR